MLALFIIGIVICGILLIVNALGAIEEIGDIGIILLLNSLAYALAIVIMSISIGVYC